MGPILIAFLAWVLIIAMSLGAYRPVAPLPADAPESQFSAARADGILKTLVGDAIPHPAGSEQNAVVRTRIVSLLESFGYQVEIQKGTGQVWASAKNRSPDRDTIELHNIIARRAGSRSGPPIMLVSHYDSVPFGPGASDDGVGTAALLEIARMLAAEPVPEREVMFLITDGEEFGLLGAELFVNEHPLAKKVALAINLEARGTTGPSLMFETSRLSRQLVPVFADSARKPMASSLFFEIYKRLPNDTDFTLLNRSGIFGFNFAFIGNVKNYHTTADNYENVDRGSLQHHGENALGLIRACVNSDVLKDIFTAKSGGNPGDLPKTDEAVYFDLFGKWIVWWPSSWSVWFCGVAAVMVVITTIGFRDVKLRDTQSQLRSRWAAVVIHVGALLFAVLLIFLTGFLIQMLVRNDPRMSNPWPLQPVPILLGFWAASFAVVSGLAIALEKWLEPRGWMIAFCLLWLVFATASSVYINGASYLFVLPLLIVTGFGVVACWFGKYGLVSTIVVAAIAVGFFWLPMERLFYDAVGFRMPIATLVRMSLLGTTVLGLQSLTTNRVRFGVAISTALGAIVAFVAAIYLNSEL